ncbi:hypothetical protein DJ73_13295 [Halorubrum sp. Ea1]|uniref:alginate lyase family protein n=1 Tax=Halorubrum sp. Ea1 TaxID=1480718 RepID=UPI000B9828BF|nr:alginate lyase family protein [Halorubrum sp. Ea1]OYR51424.1 hypothetical protein DJ73_13295 [Halorubrum sp. Ea1]
MTDYLTLAGTALNKQPRQLFGIATRKFKSAVFPRLPVNIDSRYEKRIPDEFTPCSESIRKNTIRLQESTSDKRESFQKQMEATIGGDLSFLNETISFKDGQSISVDAPAVLDQPSHWQLKCWGFEHLKPIWLSSHHPSDIPDSDLRVHQMWLNDWMDNHPIASDTGYLRRYWMPHSVSLRILNWTRYIALFNKRLGHEFRKTINQFIHKNAQFLADNIEHGVGGNHLIENAVGLVMAGVYFQKKTWRQLGIRIFEQASWNQFFEDGGHIERSPMYHLIVLQRFLTAVDLLESLNEVSRIIRETATDGVRFMEHLQPPDNQIPLLNDSVFDEALPLQSVLQYARSIPTLNLTQKQENNQSFCSLTDSGYYWLGTDEEQMLVAGHELTVPHLPAHAHIHPGHVCLWIGNQRVLTDTGVFEYSAGPHRRRARSIQNHNTVQVDEYEPVRMASSFWMWGTVDPSISFHPRKNRLKISHSVNTIGCPSYNHHRDIRRDENIWTISDQIDTERSPIRSRLHVHPDLNVKMEDDLFRISCPDRGHFLSIIPAGHNHATVIDAPYFPRYGQEISRDALLMIGSEGSKLTWKICTDPA